MKSRWKRKHNEMTCPECGFVYYSTKDDFNFCPNCGEPMNEEAEKKVKVVWHDAKTDPPKEEDVEYLVVLNGRYLGLTFENAIMMASYYHPHGGHPGEWDIETFVENMPSQLVTHWAELPEGPKEREGDATKG